MDADRQMLADALRARAGSEPQQASGMAAMLVAALRGALQDAPNAIQRNVRNSIRGFAESPQDFINMRLAQLSESLPATPQSVMPGVDQTGIGPDRPSFQDWGTNVAWNSPSIGLFGHTVYHGSPHKFDAFDASKIGTGEGAQAYGHGIYLADSKKVAESYAPAINNADLAENLRRMKEMLPNATGIERQNLERAIRDIEDGSGRHVYTADLPDEWLPKMLDWDKPLSQQTPEIQALAKRVGAGQARGPTAVKMRAFASGTESPERGIVATGEDLYRALSNYGDNSVAGSKAIGDAGIPGIRYLDQGSRGQGQGTYNYVVFPGNEGLLKILSRD